MEETGCNKEEAKYYLEETSGNITLALKNLLKVIRPIGIIKCRFRVNEVGMYGLLLFIFNDRNRKMLRYAAVIGCNPIVYETNIDQQWFLFERDLYSQRLRDGSLREVTQRIEQSLILKVQEQEVDEFYNAWDKVDIEHLKNIIAIQIREVVNYDIGKEFYPDIEVGTQKLNIRQFKYLTDTEKLDEEFQLHLNNDNEASSLIVLNSELVRPSNGSPTVRVEKIEAGDVVLVKVVDNRDIGVYLAHLIGARKGEITMPITASVEDVKNTEEGVELVVRFGPGVIGRVLENPKKKIGIIKNPIVHTFNWWYIIVLFSAVLGYHIIRLLAK